MSRNFGIGSRDMAVAGRMIIERKFHGGYQSKYDIAQRWGYFCKWVERVHSVRKMENITFEIIVLYGKQLQNELDRGDRASSSAPKSYVSAVNTVMKLATNDVWKTVRPGKDCGIEKRRYIPTESKAMSSATHHTAQRKVGDRIACLMELQRTFGLRFKESCLLSPKRALKEAKKLGHITLTAGTKGGKKRSVPCTSQGILALERAALVQDGRSMIPKKMLYVEFRREAYEKARLASISFHTERHAYAQNRYIEITGAPAPVEVGWGRKERIQKLAEFLAITPDDAEKLDHETRLKISIELGHRRKDITNAYLG